MQFQFGVCDKEVQKQLVGEVHVYENTPWGDVYAGCNYPFNMTINASITDIICVSSNEAWFEIASAMVL